MRSERDLVIDHYMRRKPASTSERAPKEVWEENETKQTKADVTVDKEVAR